ncbi:hydroxyneurosporene methyltransferase [Mycobacterium sp. PS03-16]|uniref:methyltransferase n=1 Tax=Mycobacterium sp. PS03-16 TaxID=2559611 RepID=UPI001073919B|nr:methyltransferase [Mycobacterium sp. PS03-16]TFV57317.1 hydroxyneurosporene methyltransferase [Mycobacterium sp. PS03-16]
MSERAGHIGKPPRLPPPRVVRVVERARTVLHRAYTRAVPPFAGVLDLTMGFAVAQCIYAAARLGIADVLAEGPMTVADIAYRVEADRASLHRVLRVLAAQQIFHERRDGRFEMTALSQALRADATVSIRPLLLMLSHPFYWEHFGRLTDVVRTGETSLDAEYGKGLFECLQEAPDLARVFNDAMSCVTAMSIPPVLAAYDFSRFGTIVDVGGGYGEMLTAILGAANAARGVLVELPALEGQARETFRAAGMEGRATVAPGSFFDSVPGGGDLYVLKHVLHDWSDERAADILRRVREAMSPAATLLLIEAVIPRGNGLHFGKLLDLDMLVFAGGRERTRVEFSALLRDNGFQLRRIVPTVTHLSLIEATVAPAAASPAA